VFTLIICWASRCVAQKPHNFSNRSSTIGKRYCKIKQHLLVNIHLQSYKLLDKDLIHSSAFVTLTLHSHAKAFWFCFSKIYIFVKYSLQFFVIYKFKLFDIYLLFKWYILIYYIIFFTQEHTCFMCVKKRDIFGHKKQKTHMAPRPYIQRVYLEILSNALTN